MNCDKYVDNISKKKEEIQKAEEELKKAKLNYKKCVDDSKKKQIKKSNVKKCPPNKIINPKTNRCINANGALAKKLKLNKEKKKEKKIVVSKPATKKPAVVKKPATKKGSSSSSSKSSYSPSINKKMLSSRNTEKDRHVFRCKMDEINVKKEHKQKKRVFDSDDYDCYKWNTQEAQNVMLKNLRSRRYINPKNVVGPKQTNNNCWLNTFFMSFFISDKGRKFTKYLRHAMITGILPNGKKIIKSLHRGFFILNKAIDAFLIGKDESSSFAYNFNTIKIIKLLGKKIKYRKPGEYGHPLDYFYTITNYLNTSDLVEYKVYFPTDVRDLVENADSEWINDDIRELPHVFLLNINSAWNGRPYYDHQKDIPLKKEYTFTQKNKKYKYKLDSIVARDSTNHHFVSFIKLNNKEYIFDGAIMDRTNSAYPKNWSSDFFSKKNIKVGNLTYNMKHYNMLFYYRVK